MSPLHNTPCVSVSEPVHSLPSYVSARSDHVSESVRDAPSSVSVPLNSIPSSEDDPFGSLVPEIFDSPFSSASVIPSYDPVSPAFDPALLPSFQSDSFASPLKIPPHKFVLAPNDPSAPDPDVSSDSSDSTASDTDSTSDTSSDDDSADSSFSDEFPDPDAYTTTAATLSEPVIAASDSENRIFSFTTAPPLSVPPTSTPPSRQDPHAVKIINALRSARISHDPPESAEPSSETHYFTPQSNTFPSIAGLQLKSDDEYILVLDVDVLPPDPDGRPDVNLLISEAYEAAEVKGPAKKHHQAYSPVGDKKPGVVYKRKYRKAEQRVQPIATQLPEEFRIVREITGDPLADLPDLPTDPPPFTPGKRYTQERHDKLKLNPDGFLTGEEERLAHELVKLQEDALSWSEDERGEFRSDFFPHVRIPTVPHTPWVYRNIPIPPGLHDELVKIIRDKIASGAYEPSNAGYRSRWFCVIKRDGSSLRIVHDLRPFNAVTIGDASVPPVPDQVVESFGARSCYASLDLYVAYDQRVVHPDSRDPTTFQSPLGALRHTRLVMGHTNSVQIMQGDISYILRDEIPTYTVPFIDDVAVKGPPTRYELPDGGYETIPENPHIRRFVWEHLNNVNRILQRLRYVGGTFSGKKLELCVPSIVILGQRCNYEGRVAHEAKTQKIEDWPLPVDLTSVRGFLGTCGLVRIFIRDFARHSRPLVLLTRKDTPFHFDDVHHSAMATIKNLVVHSPALRPIDYTQPWEVILAVDSSVIAVGFILMQLRDDNKRYPARFGSIAWNDRESRYSQAKLELYGLFRALRSFRIYIVGVKKLVVEVDAKYIKGMLNNPDIQPNATINRWIAGILLFDFTLRHVPATAHTAADGLSRRPRAPEDPPETDDFEEWIDESYGFFMELANFRPGSLLSASSASDHPDSLFTGHAHPDHPAEIVHAFITEEDPETIIIPRNDKATAADRRLAMVEEFLRTLVRPPGLDDTEFRQFVRYTSEFFLSNGKLWRRDPHGRHKIVVPSGKRYALIQEIHDLLGHHKIYAVRVQLLTRFWWPHLEHDVKWFVNSCHQCQIRQMRYYHVPPTVAAPASLFRKAYVDTMFMPRAGNYRYIVQARCSLSAYPEHRKLRRETGATIGAFIFEDILCRWGALEEIVTDNGAPFVEALEWLAKQYGIRHIRISPYNSQANGIVERRHLDVRESIIKLCDGDEKKWPSVTHTVFWAERIVTHRSLGHSSYFIAHGVEPLLPFDLSEATFMVPPQSVMSSADLITLRARQLEKRPEDLAAIHDRVLRSRFASAKQFEKKYAHSIRTYKFLTGALVLVRNSRVEMALDRKSKPRWFGPMIVVRQTVGGSYILAEMDGSVSRLRFAAFRVIPYYARRTVSIDPDTFFQFPAEEDMDDSIDEPPSPVLDISPDSNAYINSEEEDEVSSAGEDDEV